MKKKTLIYTAAGMIAFVLAAQAATEQSVPVSQQQKLTMTIYNAGRALVNDVRQVDFEKGHNQLSFIDISNMVMPSSVLFKADGVRVLEQNFNFDLLSLDNLMEKSIGKTVDVEYINPATGAVQSDKAELLAYDGNYPILKIKDKIETAYPGRVIFNQVPENLSARPTLVFDVNADKKATQNVEVSYLTNGISWSADYVVEMGKDNVLDLNGLVTLTNNTTVSYKNAQLQLVAGDVNMVSPVMYKTNRSRAVMEMAVASSADSMDTEAVSGYYLYTLNRPTDILSNQTKQVSLLSGDSIKAQKTYQYDSPVSYYSEYEFKNEKPTMYLTFANTQANGLGEALPKGTMRVYEKDSKGGLIFVGEDMITHTAKGQDIRLRLGEDFDITATGKRATFKKLDSKTSQAEFEIKISNAKSIPVVVRYNQTLPSGWKILSESLKSQKQTSNQIFWNVSVPAEGDIVLTFKVQVDNR